jgi:DMSO reductase family type II enzyme heme b subunit
MSDPSLRISSVEDLNANGFSTLTTQATQNVLGNGLWEPYGALKGGCCNGPRWRVVMKRSLTTDDPSDVQFQSGSSFPVAFAVWDGSNVERNGVKGISTWFTAQMPH